MPPKPPVLLIDGKEIWKFHHLITAERFEKFLSVIDIKDDQSCWNWMLNHKGVKYGQLACSGVHWIVNRLSYYLWAGFIEEGKLICHKCDNKKCVNPNHLYQGTHQDNTNDIKTRGSFNAQKGEQHYAKRDPSLVIKGELRYNARLTKEKVIEIRKLLENDETTSSEFRIAEMFGVARTTIADVKHRRTWRHIP